MLRKGQKAKSIETLQEKHKASVYARHKVLSRVLNLPKSITQDIIDACESQHDLAKWEFTAEGIFPIRSLNTLKSVAEIVFEDGGWESLDTLRRQIRSIGRSRRLRKARPRPNTKEAQSNMIKELKTKLDETQRARAVVNLGYFDLASRLRAIAKSDETIAQLLRRHDEKFAGQLGMRVIKGRKKTNA